MSSSATRKLYQYSKYYSNYIYGCFFLLVKHSRIGIIYREDHLDSDSIDC